MTTQKRTSRSNKLLRFLLRGGTVNGRQALRDFGIYRLSAVIFNWRKKGFNIETQMIKHQGFQYARYKLISTPNV